MTQNNFYAIIILIRIKIYKKIFLISIVFEGRAVQINFYLNNKKIISIMFDGKTVKTIFYLSYNVFFLLKRDHDLN